MKKNTIRFIISMIAILGGLALVLALVFAIIPTENKDIFFTSLGVVLGWAGTSVNFYLGTSQSSSDKTDMMNESK